MYSLNDLWRMLGSPKSQDPRHWNFLPDTARYLKSECKSLNVGKSDIIKSKKRKGWWNVRNAASAISKAIQDFLK